MRPAEQFVRNLKADGFDAKSFAVRCRLSVVYRDGSLVIDVRDSILGFAEALQFHRDMQEALAFMEEVKLLLEQDK